MNDRNQQKIRQDLTWLYSALALARRVGNRASESRLLAILNPNQQAQCRDAAQSGRACLRELAR